MRSLRLAAVALRLLCYAGLALAVVLLLLVWR